MSFHGGNMEAHQKSVDLMSSIPGITYLEEGTHRFTLSNGAFFTIHASPCTPSQYGSQYMLHAFQYATGEDRYNPNADTDGIGMTPSWAVNSSTPSSTIPTFPGVDIVMTQSPPKYILDHTSDGSSAGCEHLRRAISRAKPRLHCFGHIHKSYGAERIAWKSHMTHKELEDMGIECLEDFDDDIAPLPQQEPDGLMKNSSRKRGFARISQQSQDALVHGKQTLCVNAAVKEDEGRPSNAPWLVTLELPCIPTRAWNED
ncbi:hypothetical protein EV356DRAFT_323063 [Viridothelium virens]|uniref:Metallo-dependent phosphatase n=1 Tax=Viridothelium virens TaxID=1048519 RepID=A0A6A6GYI7_VIRVR|nr:hypothetical protein EV356DRAFT_323063 [Viridothelium virens]